MQTLERFKDAFPKYQNYKLYGAVAGIKMDDRSKLFATQEGLFVIAPAGDSVIIANRQILEHRRTKYRLQTKPSKVLQSEKGRSFFRFGIKYDYADMVAICL